MDIPELVTRWREAKGLTPSQLARGLQVTRGAVYNWENGLSPPTTKNIRKMAELFGVTVGDFWSKPPRARRKRAA